MRVRSMVPLQSEINITPLVDVCLVLLIIFMVITPVIVNGMPVRLPEARTAAGLGKAPLQITINADRTIYVDSLAIRSEQLTAELEHRRDPSRPVVVRADKTLAYGDVVRVLDACRGAGFENVGLAAQKQD